MLAVLVVQVAASNIKRVERKPTEDIRTRARLLGYLYAEGSCANPRGGGDRFAIGVSGAQNARALWCGQQMEDKGLLTIVSATPKRIVLKNLPWEISYAPVSWNTNIFKFIAAIIEGEGSVGGLIADQSGWGDHPLHITELRDLLNKPVYDCDAYLTRKGKDVRIPAQKFSVVRKFEYVSTGRVPGGPKGLAKEPTPPKYARP